MSLSSPDLCNLYSTVIYPVIPDIRRPKANQSLPDGNVLPQDALPPGSMCLR